VAKASLAQYDAQMAGRAHAPTTGVVRSVIGGAQALAQLAGDAAYVIPEAILPESSDRGSRVRYVQALVGIGNAVAHPIDTISGHYRSGLDVAQQYRDAGNEFEAEAAEWQAHADMAQVALGAQQLARSGLRAGVNFVESRAARAGPEIGPRDIDLDLDTAAVRAPDTSALAKTTVATESTTGLGPAIVDTRALV